MDINAAVAYVIEDQRENSWEDLTGWSDAAIVAHVRNVIDVVDLVDHGDGDQSFEAYRQVLTASEDGLTLAIFGYETYIRATGSEGAANTLNGSPDALTEWEFPLLYPSGCPVSADHLTRWHHDTTGHAVTGIYKQHTLWYAPGVSA